MRVWYEVQHRLPRCIHHGTVHVDDWHEVLQLTGWDDGDDRAPLLNGLRHDGEPGEIFRMVRFRKWALGGHTTTEVLDE